MASNPLVPLGSLNKLRGTVSLIENPQLNVTASYLGDDGISLSFDGSASGYLPQMAGAVPSPNPFQVATATIHLLKTQGLSNLWKLQMENNAVIGDVVITADASTLTNYTLSNSTIRGVNELQFAGKDAGYVVTVQGTYYINSSLWDLQ